MRKLETLEQLEDREPLRLLDNPSGRSIDCTTCRQYANNQITVDLTSWFYVSEFVRIPVGAFLTMCERCVDAAKAACDKKDPNPNYLPVSPVCLACFQNPAEVPSGFGLNEDFFIEVQGERTEITNFGICSDCVTLASRLVGAERSKQKKKELV